MALVVLALLAVSFMAYSMGNQLDDRSTSGADLMRQHGLASIEVLAVQDVLIRSAIPEYGAAAASQSATVGFMDTVCGFVENMDTMSTVEFALSQWPSNMDDGQEQADVYRSSIFPSTAYRCPEHHRRLFAVSPGN